VAVVDVGGGSTEIAVGTLLGGVEWSASIPVGSSDLADEHLHSDPPSAAELAGLQADARLLFSGAHPPASDVGVAVGGSATSIARLVPGGIDDLAVGRVLELLASAPSARIAADHHLEAERVRLLPAGLSLLAAVAERLECPLTVGDGGLREGVCVELTTGA
jgi:exopolyphosphatase/guanosine-5'-triphosphate,3'-diphosphate pyrophosphatase